jgi:hypothetical protein
MLTEHEDDYAAHTHPSASLDIEAVISRMLQRGTLLTRTDILAVWNNLCETIKDIHLEGNTVNLPLFNTSFSISGVFDSPLDVFDPNRHKLNINVTKGAILRDAEKNIHVEKTNVPSPNPQIQEVKDSISGTVNERFTSGGVVEIRGYNLRIDGDNPKCGLWFIDDNGNEIKAETIIENKPSRILAMIPNLTVSNYQVKVVTQYKGSGTLLKEPKTFVYQKKIQVFKQIKP